MIKTKITRRLFAGIAAAAPAALAKAPAGLALGEAVALSGMEVPSSCGPISVAQSSSGIMALWKQIDRYSERRARARSVVTREAAGILDPEIQALTACSPVYRMHLQLAKDERAESIIQKLRDRIDQLEKLG